MSEVTPLPPLWTAICRRAGLADSASLDTVHKAVRKRVGRGTIQRIRDSAKGTSMESLLEISAGLECNPGDLLNEAAGVVAAPPPAPAQPAAAPQPVSFGAAMVELGALIQQLAPIRRKLIATHAAEILEHGPTQESAETLNDLARGITADMPVGGQSSDNLAAFLTIAKIYADRIAESNSRMTPSEFITALDANKDKLLALWREMYDVPAGAKVTQ